MLKKLVNSMKGFTLIELLVVITIIGILATVVSINYSTAQKSTRDNKRKIDLETSSAAIECYYTINKSYPKVENNWDSLAQQLRSAGCLQTMPVDPKNDATYKYNYITDVSSGAWFGVYGQLENKNSTITLPGSQVNAFPTATNVQYGNGTFKVGEAVYYRTVGK